MAKIIDLDARRPATILRRVAGDIRAATASDIAAMNGTTFDALVVQATSARNDGSAFDVLRAEAPAKLLDVMHRCEALGLTDVADMVSLACAVVEGEDVACSATAERAARVLERAAETLSMRAAS